MSRPPAAPSPREKPTVESDASPRCAFGVGLWGGVPADGCEAPKEQAPSAWLAQLVQQHADSALRTTLFQVSRGSRDLILSQATHAQLTIGFRQTPSGLSEQLSAARHALLTRGEQPTRLVVDAPWPSTLPTLLAEQLVGAGAGVTEVRVEGAAAEPDTDVGALVGAVALVCSHLQSLTLVRLSTSLPPPQQLPCLTALSMSPHGTLEQCVCAGVAQYMTQLTSLDFPTSQHRPCWPLFFTPLNAPSTLVTLSARTVLTDSVVGLLLDHAPGLQRIMFYVCGVETDVHRDRVWGVTHVTLPYDDRRPGGWAGGHRDEVLARKLARLPLSASGKLHITLKKAPMHFSTENDEGLSASITSRLPHWVVTGPKLCVLPGSWQPPGNSPTALSNALRQLATVTTTDPSTLIEASVFWAWDDAMVDTVTETVNSLSHSLSRPLRLGVVVQTLTDTLLGQLLRLGPAVRSLAVHELRLQHDTHADAVCSWEEICFLGAGVGCEVARLPRPDMDRPVRVHAASFIIDAKNLQLICALAPRLMTWLRGARWHSHGGLKLSIPYSDTHTTLHTLVSILRTVCFADAPTERASSVWLQRWSLTRQAVTVLQRLPKWECVIRFTHCTWPMRPAEYVLLAGQVPSSYRELGVAKGVPRSVLAAIQHGAKESRAAMGLAPLTVTTMDM